jgi:tetratricopeptide (TPR) repeat protein
MLGCRDLPASIQVYEQAAGLAAATERRADQSDSLSRAGLAAMWYGDWPRAAALLSESERITRHHLGEHDPRVARALSNRAELSARSGRPDRALLEIKEALRLRARDTGPRREHRTRVSEWTRVSAYVEHGYVTRAANLAAQLHEAEVGASHLVIYGRALRLAGRPSGALAILAEAEWLNPRSHWLEIRSERAACLLDCSRDEEAADLLAPLAANWRWYAERISPRLTFQMLIRFAHARWDVEAMETYRKEARERPGTTDDDPLLDEFGCVLARLLRDQGHVPQACAELALVERAQAERIRSGRLFDFHPAVATTRLELAECAESDDLCADAAGHYRWIADDPALDLDHPLRVSAVLGLARLAHRQGADASAISLLDTLPAPDSWPFDRELEISTEFVRLRRMCGAART